MANQYGDLIRSPASVNPVSTLGTARMMHPGVGRIKNRADFSDADRGIVAQTRGDLDRRADQQRAKETRIIQVSHFTFFRHSLVEELKAADTGARWPGSKATSRPKAHEALAAGGRPLAALPEPYSAPAARRPWPSPLGRFKPITNILSMLPDDANPYRRRTALSVRSLSFPRSPLSSAGPLRAHSLVASSERGC